MKLCPTCKIEKQLYEFYSYKSKRANKIVYRNECISCFRDKNTESVRKYRLNKKMSQFNPESQPVVLEEELVEQLELIEGISKKCTICTKVMLVDKFKNKNGRSTGNKCHICLLKYQRDLENEKNRVYGGTQEYYKEPGRWYSDEQKEAVSLILLSIGWKFNDEKNIWYKPKIKNSEGIFLKLKPFVKPPSIYITRMKDRNNNLRNLRTPETINEMIRLRKEKYTYVEIAEVYSISKTTVREWLKKKK